MLWFYYDDMGVSGMRAFGEDFFFMRNKFGDVMAIYDGTGTRRGSYTYDAWGRITSLNNYCAQRVADWNPWRWLGMLIAGLVAGSIVILAAGAIILPLAIAIGLTLRGTPWRWD